MTVKWKEQLDKGTLFEDGVERVLHSISQRRGWSYLRVSEEQRGFDFVTDQGFLIECKLDDGSVGSGNSCWELFSFNRLRGYQPARLSCGNVSALEEGVTKHPVYEIRAFHNPSTQRLGIMCFRWSELGPWLQLNVRKAPDGKSGVLNTDAEGDNASGQAETHFNKIVLVNTEFLLGTGAPIRVFHDVESAILYVAEQAPAAEISDWTPQDAYKLCFWLTSDTHYAHTWDLESWRSKPLDVSQNSPKPLPSGWWEDEELAKYSWEQEQS